MNIAISAACIIGAIVALLPVARIGETWSNISVQSANVLGWLGVLGGAVGIYFAELSGIASLLAIAGCAMLAVLPANMPTVRTRRFSAPWVAAPALALGVSSVLGLTDANVGGTAAGQSELLLLYAAVFGGLAATVSSLISATSLADLALAGDEPATPGVGAALLSAALIAAVWLLGSAHSTSGAFSWAAPLAVGGEPLAWRIPDAEQLPRGLRFRVAANLSFVIPSLVAGLVAAAAAAWLGFTGRSRSLAGGAWALLAAVSGGVLFALTPGRIDASAPDVAVYTELATNWLVDRGLPERFVELGDFTGTGAATIDLTAMLPVYVLLGGIFLVATIASLHTFLGESEPEKDRVDAPTVSMLSRDLTVRAMIIGWLSWLMTVLVHWTHFGYFGVGSPSEATLVGALTLASGLGLLGWSLPRRAPWGRLRALAAGVMLLVLVLAIVVSLVFNTPAGLSLSL